MRTLPTFLILIALLLPGTALGLGFTHELTEAEIQQRVDMQMPLRRKTIVADVLIQNPQVVLKEGSDRIGIRADIQATFLDGSVTNGSAFIDGKIRYVPESGEFFFVEPELKELDIENASARDQEMVRGIADVIIKKALTMFPVYELRDDDLKQKFAKSMLKSVTVRDRKLVLELGL